MAKLTFRALLGEMAYAITLRATAQADDCIAPPTLSAGWDFTCRQIGRIMQELGVIPGTLQVTNMAGSGVACTHVVSERGTDAGLIVAASCVMTIRLAQKAFADMTAGQVRWLGALGGGPGVIAVAKDSPCQTLNDRIGAVKADPLAISFAGGSALGGFDHLKVLIEMDRAGFEETKAINYIDRNCGADAIVRTVGGFSTAMTGDLTEIQGFIKSGDARALAVLSDAQVSGFDEIPTAREQGVVLVGMNWRGHYVPKGISDANSQKWVDALTDAAESEQ